MKNVIIIFAIFFAQIAFSQNRYSTVTTSKYEPMPTPNAQYYQAVAERKMNEIGRKYQYYTTQVNQILQSNDNVDQDLKLDMYNIRSYLNPLAGELSMDEAQWYINKVEKLYNKAVRNYNKRLKKAQKK